jgi:NAD(P)H-dependent FMN reductase
MHIVLISGSHRENSQSLRVTKYLASQISNLDKSSSTDIIELTGNPLPLWDEGMWKPDTNIKKQWQPYSKRLQKADGLVVTSPEWHGMVPAGLKNFFLFCGVKEVGHKPALITTVSASRGGSYPITELRTSSYKNNRICYLPEHLIIRDVNQMLHGDQPATKDDEFIRDRIEFALKILLDYTRGLKVVRENKALFEKKYENGM